MDTRTIVQVYGSTVPQQSPNWEAIMSHIDEDLGHWQDKASTKFWYTKTVDHDDPMVHQRGVYVSASSIVSSHSSNGCVDLC